MSIVSCPRCGDKVSVPPAASPSALVQCPLCLEEYFLSDALIQLPPMLVVVGGHAAAAPAEKEEYRLAEPVAAAVSAAEFDGGGGTAVAARPQLRTVSRRRPQERGVLGEIVKIVLGGVAGLAGGLLVLWWGFGVDVADLAPKVSKVQYLRFLVPPKLRAQTVTPDPKSSQLDTMDAETGDARRRTNLPQNEWASAGDGDSSRPGGNGNKPQGKPAKGTKQGKEPAEDPFAALDFPGTATQTSEATEVKIDDPLSAIKPPTKEGKPKTKEEPPAADEAGSKDKAEDTDSKESKDDKPAAEKPKEKPKSDEPKPDEPKADTPKPEEPKSDAPKSDEPKPAEKDPE